VPDDPLLATLRAEVAGDVRAGEPLAAHTTLRVGGPARAMVRAESVEDLRAVGRACAAHGVPWLVLGRGSNLLVPQAGWDGVVLVLGRAFRGVEVRPGGTPGDRRVLVGGAEPMPVLAAALERRGLGGMAFAVAIPGSVGGAVRMNAGAHGGQVADVLVRAEVVRLATGEVADLPAADLQMAYRRTALPPDAVVTRVELSLAEADPGPLAAEMAEMRRWRRAHQPINEPSCGSVFTNPPGDSAGRLVEAAGLKGHRVGGARVSEVHANFITVEPGASADDVLAVIRHVQREVRRVHGVLLHPEVVIAGDAPDDRPAPVAGP
jgi:UDP-N-acetylmuramate dehydrogenase